MKKLIVILVVVLLSGCKIWEWGDVYTYHIPAGKHAAPSTPYIIEETEKWGGEMILSYDPDKMVDTVENFSYWNKLGGIMPDINSNWIEGQHQSARAAWRVDPTDTQYIYIGYIVYVWGKKQPLRGYLLDGAGNRIRIPVGDIFYPIVTYYGDHWGVYVKYKGLEARKRFDDESLRREKFLVVMDPYYGGNPVAPTDITITLKVIDTTWLY